jgi:hypothetical protein
MKRLSMGILAFSLLIVSALPAQDLTGRLEGRILDPEGESLAAALISVTGACLQGEQQTKSDERGRGVLFRQNSPRSLSRLRP